MMAESVTCVPWDITTSLSANVRQGVALCHHVVFKKKKIAIEDDDCYKNSIQTL